MRDLMTSPGRAARAISYVILIVWTVFTLFPLYWTAITSIKSSQTVNLPVPTFIPWVQFAPTLQPFRDIFGEGEGYGVSGMGNVALLFRNSFGAAFFSSLIAVVLGAMAAYALSRFRYRRWKTTTSPSGSFRNG
jgi:multiple sugar transport system permease protein